METVSSQLLSRNSLDRAAEAPGESSRQDRRVDGHHQGHQSHPAQRRGMAHGVGHHREIGDRREEHTRHPGHAADSTALAYRRTDRTSLLVETREGDSVRLKIKAHETLTLETGENPVTDVQLQARSRMRIAIRIDGDLNENELTAIQNIIDQAGTMAAEFFSGEAADAFATASALEIDATQLANVRIRMRSSEQLTYPTGTGMQALARSPEVTGSDNPVAGTSTSAAATTPDEQETATVTAENGNDGAVDPTAQATDANEGSETATSPDRDQVMANALQSIGEFMNNLLSAFAGASTATDNSFPAVDMTLKLQVFRSMLLSINELDNPTGDEPATTLAADTIDAVTAQQVPLDEVA